MNLSRHEFRKGVALVVTLLLLSVITFLAVAFLALSRRDRQSVAISITQTESKYLAETAAARAQAEIFGFVAAKGNLGSAPLMVSRTYQNQGGFDPGVSSFDNVNWDRTISGGALNEPNRLQMLTNLFFDPRLPVFVQTNANLAAAREFRFFLDFNRNGRFDTNGLVGNLDASGNLIGSYNAVGDPLKLRYSYEQVGAELAQLLVDRDGKLDMLFIGGGGYTLPRYVEALWPDAKIDVAEVDPAVTRVAYEHLDVPANPNIVTYNMDARQYLISNAGNKRYNFILGDAFNDFSVPYHLTTQEFNHLVKDHLADDGVYMLNLIDGGDLPFATAVMRTLRSVFPHVYFLPVNKAYIETQRNTMLVLASSQPIDMAKLGMIPGSDRERQSADWLVSQPQLDALLAKGPQFLLTDDYVPTEQLLTPVFESANAVK